MKNILVFAAAFMAVIALAPVSPAQAQFFAGLGGGLGAAIGHGEEESSLGDGKEPRQVALADRQRERPAGKTASHRVKAVQPAHIND